MTYYLKYRSQTLDQLDLEKVRDQLQKIVSSGRVPHALLFSGPRGSGKTSAARILAKVVNCEIRDKDKDKDKQSLTLRDKQSLTLRDKQSLTLRDKQSLTLRDKEPCNKCGSCVAITKGSSLDVIEIDAASNRGVDDIRTLRETVKLSPISARMKVYIIDEAHMLTTEASNALLKTLEEPPAHAMFILATTAPEKLLDTIRSRSTLINFYKGTVPEVIRSLKRVVKGEKLKVEDGVLEEIAGRVDGSFREAHKTLEQLSFGVEQIKLESVKNLLTSNIANPGKLISLLAAKDTIGGIGEIGEIVEKGASLKVYGVELVRLLRESMFAKLGVGGNDTARDLNVEDLRQLIELFCEAVRQIPTAVIPQLPLEMAIVKWCGEDRDRDKDKETNISIRVTEKVAVEQVLQTDTSFTEKSEEVEEKKEKKKTASTLTEAELEEKWKEIMKKTKDKNHSLEALLRACKPLSFDGRNLQVEVFYPFHKERLEKELYTSIFEKVASGVIGVDVRLESVLSSSKKRAADVTNVLAPKEEDLVKVAEEIFGGN